jgi:hypothetical protein
MRIAQGRARRYTDQLINLITDACDRLEPTGELRRGRGEIQVIELLVTPKLYHQDGMFDGPPRTVDTLRDTVKRLRKADRLISQPSWKRTLHATFRADDGQPVPIALHWTDPCHRGWDLAITTGPAIFASLLRTSDRRKIGHRRGLLPHTFKVAGGRLHWRIDDEVCPIPTEKALERLLGVRLPPPPDRR